MIVLVDMEHEISLQDDHTRAAHDTFTAQVRRRLEEISGTLCVEKHFREVSRSWLRSLGAQAVVIGGNAADWLHYTDDDLSEMVAIIRAERWPTLGLCGGMQMIARAYGVRTRLLSPLAPDEADISPQYGSEQCKEGGYLPVRIAADDPIWQGMAEQPVFLFAHFLELEHVPPGFVNLATTDQCSIQLIRHNEKPIYGVQFHPEAYTSTPGDAQNWLVEFVYPEGYNGPAHPDGRHLLENFFRLTGVIPV
jgi:GMP synthase-like glutamine amidotransferase